MLMLVSLTTPLTQCESLVHSLTAAHPNRAMSFFALFIHTSVPNNSSYLLMALLTQLKPCLLEFMLERMHLNAHLRLHGLVLARHFRAYVPLCVLALQQRALHVGHSLLPVLALRLGAARVLLANGLEKKK